MQVRNLGKPVDLAGQYYKDGADEVCFLLLMAQKQICLDFVYHSPFGFSD